jgi:protein O-mannosyl-transferase
MMSLVEFNILKRIYNMANILNKIGSTFIVLLCLWGCTKKTSDSAVLPPSMETSGGADKLEELQKNAESSPSYENKIALGLELANRNRLDEAVFVYEQAVQINPKAPIAYNNICAAFNVLGRFADAVESCETAVKLEPNFELAKNNLQIAKEKFANYRSELMAKKPELLKSVKTSEDQLNVGMQLFLARDLETANKLWSKIPPSDPFYPAALNNLASSQILEGKFADAERSLDKALSLQPGNKLFSNNKRWLESKKLTK